MRQGPNNKRMRSRGSGRKHSNPRSYNYESNGPDVKVRGNAQQVVEKYLSLARDAYSAGDRVSAESYYQHAEHYYRVLNANAANEQRFSTPNADMNAMDDNGDDQFETEDATETEEAAEASASGPGRGNGGRRRSGRNNGNRKDPADEPQPEVGASSSDEPAAEDASEGANV